MYDPPQEKWEFELSVPLHEALDLIGCERARAAEEDCVDREGDLAVLGEIDLNALRDQRVGIWIADLDDLKAAGEGERLRIGKRRSGEIVKADYVQSATGARLDDKGFILHILVEEGIISKEKPIEVIFGVVEPARKNDYRRA